MKKKFSETSLFILVSESLFFNDLSSLFWTSWAVLIILDEILSPVLHFYYTGKMFEIGNWYKLGLLWHIPESNNYTHIGDMLFPKMVGCILKRWGVTGEALAIHPFIPFPGKLLSPIIRVLVF